MKNLSLAIFLPFCIVAACRAQSLSLADDFGPLANSAVVVQSGPSDTLQLITWLHLANTTGNTLRVMMKKEEISVIPGTSSSICWAGYCYGPEMMVSTFPLTMLPGELVSGCFAHFGPNGCRGVSTIRWTFFNVSDPADSLSITVHYSTFPSSTGNMPGSQFSLSMAGPVPADQEIRMKYSLPAGLQGMMELRDLAGNVVSSGELEQQSGTNVFCSAGLPAGLYFCTLVMAGRPVTIRKIIVCH